MKTYIAMLRGINVSGQKKIKMADLRSHLAELPFQNIQTYIQSGNIVLEAEDISTSNLEEMISNKIAEKYNFEVPTLTRTKDEFQEVIDRNPYSTKDLTRLYITFLKHAPDQSLAESINQTEYEPEEFILDGKIIYFFSPNGYGRAKMNNNFFEKKLKVFATTRNWKTVNKLLEMGQ